MSISEFFKLAEIKTKIASFLPFIGGVVYGIYRFRAFNPLNTLLFFISLIFLDMGVTTLNNIMDFKKAIKKDGYNYREHNAMVKHEIDIKKALTILGILASISIITGIILYIRTDYIVLVIGIIGFTIGLSYSFGPLPISYTPLGEIFSGGTMGLLIFFLAIYIQVPDPSFFLVDIDGGTLLISLDYKSLLGVALLSIPYVLLISNIMLANNICDIDDDIHNGRKTLPAVLGRVKALNLFTSSIVLSYLGVILAIILNLLPITSLITFISIPLVLKCTLGFLRIQDKKSTFENSVKIFVLISVTNILGLLMGLVI